MRALILAPFLLLQGCVVLVPASVTNAAADAITGAEGEHCAAAGARPGDVWVLPEGPRIIESVSGPSYRCSDPNYPIRVKLKPPRS